MGQVNTMIGNLRNMAIDMGSELENQNDQVDRINRKVISIKLKLVTELINKKNKLDISDNELRIKYTFTNPFLFIRVFAPIHRANQMNLE